VISVLIPTKNGGLPFVRCLQGIRSQDVRDEVEIVVVDSGSTDGSVDQARAHGARVHEIPPSEFVHGATRNLAARISSGDTLVFTSQDAIPADESWLRLLTSPLADPEVAAVYGRQLPHADAAAAEEFFLDFMYGPAPRVQRLSALEDVSFERTLFSNANSAMRRADWEVNPFADDVEMSEDQEWSRRMLLQGKAIVYEPRAAVRHSHTYSLRDAYRRFHASGVSSTRSYMEGTTSAVTLARAMTRYGGAELGWLWRSGRRRDIPYTIVYELTKAAGLVAGMLAAKRR
jgi:rhamnosyltransferase